MVIQVAGWPYDIGFRRAGKPGKTPLFFSGVNNQNCSANAWQRYTSKLVIDTYKPFSYNIGGGPGGDF